MASLCDRYQKLTTRILYHPLSTLPLTLTKTQFSACYALSLGKNELKFVFAQIQNVVF